jgi:PKD repeat protein
MKQIAFFSALCVFTFSLRAETVTIDANTNKHPIDPRIYGVAFAPDAATLSDLNTPMHRSGGNGTTRYNWQLNATNHDADWYFESIDDGSPTAGASGDSFVSTSKAGGAQPMLTIPMLGWVAKLGPGRSILPSFSVAKYGAQQATDPWMPDAGNGVHTDGTNVTGNDPNDANVPADSTFQQGWVQHLISKWNNAANGGVGYYLLDNEHSIWQGTHRDVHPTGATMDEISSKMITYATMIKSQDAGATVLGPEEWGWDGYLYSGYDQQYAAAHGWSSFPDKAAHGNLDYVAYLLQQMKAAETTAGKRLLDVFSLHWYPQGGEFSNDTSAATVALRNKSTRSLWDPNYVDQSWVGTQVYLIPRMKAWVNQYYPNTKIAITEYNWGAEGDINGATTQADIFGIFGREGLDMATRWTTPANNTPTYLAMKMYRNYDNAKSTFGDTSISAGVTNPDNLSAFAATRSTDGAMTVMVINKVGTSSALTLSLANFTAGSAAHVYQLTSSNAINHLSDVAVSSNQVTTTVPAQSITLFVIPTGSTNKPPVINSGPTATPNPVQAGQSASFSVSASDPDGDTLTYSWTFGDSGTGSGSAPSHTYSSAGSFTATVTVSDPGGLKATKSVVVTVNPAPNTPPVINSGPTATPNPAQAGQAVSFDVAASDPDGDLLTYAWTFGDSGTGSTATPSHTYSAAGSYQVQVTVSDTASKTAIGTTTVVITAAGSGGGGGGSGGSGSGGGGTGGGGGGGTGTTFIPMTVSKMQGSAKFGTSGHDACSVTGIIPSLSAHFDPTGQTLALNIGGAIVSFTLDSKGHGKAADGTLTLKLKPSVRNKTTKKLDFLGGNVQFSAKIKSGTWASVWGLDPNASGKNLPMNIVITIGLGGSNYQVTAAVKYTPTKGAGKFKM